MVRTRIHVCQVSGCDYAAINAKDLQGHNRRKHSAELLSCSKCTKKFTDQSNLNRHQRSCGQISDELWYCPFCHDSRTNRRDNVVRHIGACPQRGGRVVFVPPKAAAADIDRMAAEAAQIAALEVAAPAQVHNFDFASPVVQVAQPAIVPAAGSPPQQLQSLVGYLPEGHWGDFWSHRATSILQAGCPGPEWYKNAAFDARVMAMLTEIRAAATETCALNYPGRYDQWVAEVDAWMRPIAGEDDELSLVRGAALYHFYWFERFQGGL